MLTVTDRNKLVTTNQYDILGRLTQTLQPDGTSDVAELYLSAGFTDFVPPQTALYYSVSYKNLVKNAGAWGKTYTFYDTYSRPLRIVTQGLQGELIYTDYTYNETGRIAAISEPYPGTGEPTQWTTNTYDALGRVTDLTLPTAAVVHTDFTGLTTKVTNTTTGIWKETTVDVVGNPVEIKDPSAGSIKYMYNALAKVRSINSQGAITLFSYDDAGNQAQVNDPDAGVTAYRYNGFGELRMQTDARSNINTITYDKLGRIHTKILTPDNETSLYTYEQTNTNNGFGQLLNIAKTTNNTNPITTAYVYDNLARVINKTETIDGNSYTFAYAYSSSSGMIENYTYPSNYTITYLYSPYGHMKSIVNFGKGFEQTLWTATAANERGQITDYRLGNGLTTHKDYDEYGMPVSIVTKNAANTVLQNLAYNFDPFTGNLTQKTEMINNNTILTETYEYDPILKERLTSWQVNAGTPCAMQYTSNGNIQSKSDVNQPTTGQYTYGASAGPHAVTGITQPTSGYLASANRPSVFYNGNNKVKFISPGSGGEYYEITYGTNSERVKSHTFTYLKSTGYDLQTKYYFDDFEVEIDEKHKTRYLNYVSAGSGLVAIIEIKNDFLTPYYIHTDYQGNYNVITDATGTKLETLAFDPWGRRRNPTNWSFTNVPTTFLFDRGYTGHEHLDRFGLINMNGRVYDPALARFLSPDPFISNPANSQSYNRYSYCFNNPLKYTDPSGYTAFTSWEEFYAVVDNLLGSQNGGSWSSSGGGPQYYSNQGEAKQGGATFNNCFGSWGNTKFPDGATVKVHSPTKINTGMTWYVNGDGLMYKDKKDAYSYEYVANHHPQLYVDKNNSNGPDWKFYASILGAYAEKAYYSEKYGTWMGKNFRLYNATWGGNGFTGGKNSFGKTTSNTIKWAGRALGAWNAYSINEQRRDGKINDSQWFLEQSSNAFSVFGGIYGAAWSLGWEFGRIITNTQEYQEFKFNYWYNQFEKDFGPPSTLNEDQWLDFYLNYKKQ